DSGKYILTVTAVAPLGEISEAETELTVNIKRKELDIGGVKLEDYEEEYNGGMQSTEYSGGSLPAGVRVYKYAYYKGSSEISNDGISDAGEYTVEVTFIKNNSVEAANYDIKTLSAAFVIKPRALTFNSWVRSDTQDTSAITYDSTYYGYEMKVDGICGEEEISLTYLGGDQKNAGNYTTTLTGIDDKNYTIDKIDQSVRSHNWEIKPREVKVASWTCDNLAKSSAEYDGTVHNVKALLSNKISGDKVEFEYNDNYTVSAKNAGNYTAEITGVNNGNYYFDKDAEGSKYSFSWEITKRPLSIGYEDKNFTYNGKKQYMNATVSNFVVGELSSENIGAGSFVCTGTTEELDVTGKISGNNFILEFGGTDAKNYIASITALSNTDLMNNYSLEKATKEFTIDRRTITLKLTTYSRTYNGYDQTFDVELYNMVEPDISNIDSDFCDLTAGKFTETTISKKSSKAVITCYVKNADDYSLTLDGVNNSNYIIGANNAVNFSIDKRTIAVSEWTVYESNDLTKSVGTFTTGSAVNEVTYNFYGYKIAPVITGAVGGDSVSLDLTGDYEDKKDAGSYSAVAKLNAAYKNYKMDDVEIDWEIAKYNVSLKWYFADTDQEALSGSVIYDGTLKTVVPVATGLPGGLTAEDLDIKYSNQTLSATNANVSGYNRITTTSLGNANFQLEKNYDFTWH
ncbi:MAG: hypothetical protein J6T42_00860, partial [Clostridia bacterium]|nr:hypothetical protein [Clostridia bacterium]